MSGAKHQEALVSNLRFQRMEQELTQAELGIRIGVSRKTINTVENGIFVPSTILALKLARTFGVAVEDLFQLAD